MTRFAGSVVALAWDPVPGASYQVFPKPAGGVYGDPIATVQSGTYVDGGVTIGNAYSYVVRAVVAGRTSIPSNEVTQTTSAQLVQVTWRVRVPSSTPAGDTVFTSLDPATPDAHESVRAWIDIPS